MSHPYPICPDLGCDDCVTEEEHRLRQIEMAAGKEGWRKDDAVLHVVRNHRRALVVIEAAQDYIATHGHWPHDSDCAHSLAHEAGHYEGEFMKDRHWVYDSSVKCDCKLGALSRAVLGYENTQLSKPE